MADRRRPRTLAEPTRQPVHAAQSQPLTRTPGSQMSSTSSSSTASELAYTRSKTALTFWAVLKRLKRRPAMISVFSKTSSNRKIGYARRTRQSSSRALLFMPPAHITACQFVFVSTSASHVLPAAIGGWHDALEAEHGRPSESVELGQHTCTIQQYNRLDGIWPRIMCCCKADQAANGVANKDSWAANNFSGKRCYLIAPQFNGVVQYSLL